MRKLNKKGKILIITIILFLIFFCYTILVENKHETHIIKATEKYNIKIDYPYIKNKKIRKNIKNYVKDKEKEFNKILKNNKFDYPLDLNIMVSFEEYNNIKYVVINNYTFFGGNHYNNEKISYIYKKDLLNINDFLIADGLNKISILSYYKIMQLNNKDKLFLDEWVKEGTLPLIENYKHFKFNEKGLEITFPPYQVSDYSNGEIKILLTYDEINKYLKEEYREENKDLKVSIGLPNNRDLNQFKDKKLIAFTFDDGPSYHTNYLLDNLDKYNAKVSFFVLGSRVMNNKEVLKRAYLEGHTIGNHSYNHRNFNLLKNNEILDEVFNTNKNIKKIIGIEPTLIRPPYGNLKNLNLIDMNIILWDVDTLDWKYKDKNIVCNRILNNVHDGSIVLAHDLYKTSIDGVLLAMEELSKQGYAFVTIDEMVKIKNIDLESNKKYYNLKDTN